jgi:hypothetical protein
LYADPLLVEEDTKDPSVDEDLNYDPTEEDAPPLTEEEAFTRAFMFFKEGELTKWIGLAEDI